MEDPLDFLARQAQELNMGYEMSKFKTVDVSSEESIYIDPEHPQFWDGDTWIVIERIRHQVFKTRSLIWDFAQKKNVSREHLQPIEGALTTIISALHNDVEQWKQIDRIRKI